MGGASYSLHAVGTVRSQLQDLLSAPRQGDEGGVEAWLELSADVLPALAGIRAGDELVVVTWLHLADRRRLQVHPRDDVSRPLTGVFATRSPDRPNPIGLHRVTVQEIAGARIRVSPLEAVDGTPVVDIKPVLGETDAR